MASPGYSEGAPPGPPPPPPPPVPGQVPALRINTASEFGLRSSPSDSYEPPAAIQNAMMTKDKKPFTYTPGMGGKLDLSQIRSPRMARRVAKNANDEGIEGPPKSALTQQPQLSHQPTIMYTQPQVAVPVLPQGMPQQSPVHLRNSTLPRSLPGGGIIVPVIERQVDPAPRPVVKVETKIQPSANSPDTQTPPISPTQVTLSKAPTPWMQKPQKQSEKLPEWAKRTNNGTQDEAYSNSPLDYEYPSSPPPRQIVVVTTPSNRPQSQPQENQQQQQQQKQQQQQQMRPVRQENERAIPIRIEDRPSVFTAMNEPGHHQLMNSAPHHQSRWGNPIGQSGYQQSQTGTHIIPIQFDGQQQYQVPTSPAINNNQYRNILVDNRNVRGYVPMSNQPEPGPVQSKSFRVLQKITDTDPDQINEDHLRKLQLNEEDKYLMNKFKEQVDGDVYLHKEEDPRYRGAAIPSRAFRYLQNMTDSGDAPNSNSTAVKTVGLTTKKQNRNSNTFDEVTIPVQYVPASQQQVQEPKKYMGGAIPSRSFKILQAMTAPESIATQVTQENRHCSATDFIHIRGNQQDIYYLTHSHIISPVSPFVFRNPDTGWLLLYSIPSYDNHKPHRYSYYDNPNQYSYFFNTDIITHPTVVDSMCNTHFSNDNDSYVSELNDNNSDEYPSVSYGKSFSRTSDLCVGSQWRHNLSTTPTCCTTTNTLPKSSDKFIKEQPFTPYSPLFTTKGNYESQEGENDEDSKISINKEDNACIESSVSSSDSCSFLDYLTGLNRLNKKLNLVLSKDINDNSEKKCNEDEASTDCENETLLKNDEEFINENETFVERGEQEDEKEENERKINEEIEDDNMDKNLNKLVNKESISNLFVNVSLSLRSKFPLSTKNESIIKITAIESDNQKNFETSVTFTLKKFNQVTKDKSQLHQETIQTKPTFIITTTDDDQSEINNRLDVTVLSHISKEKGKNMLSVENYSKEDVIDDDNNGVMSDVSRIISEVDTDSGCCLVTPEEIKIKIPNNTSVSKTTYGNKKYYRTQTHSRLFKLLANEQFLGDNLSTCGGNLSNFNGLTSPDCDYSDESIMTKLRHHLPKRSKSLDCEALLRCQKDGDHNSYYQSWKNGERGFKKPIVDSVQWILPRVNVLCPRIKSVKNTAQSSRNCQQLSHIKYQLGSTIFWKSPNLVGTSERY